MTLLLLNNYYNIIFVELETKKYQSSNFLLNLQTVI